MRSLSFVLGALSSVATLAGCAVSSPDPGPEATSTTATAIVAVERTIGPGDTVRADTVAARFVRVRQGLVDEAALRVAGVSDDVPAPGVCTEPNDSSHASIQGRSVDLLDVGQVTVATDSARKSLVLSPRTMPDPAGVVSGVFYTSRSAEAFGAGGKVALRSTGGADLDAFSLNVTAPRELADVRIGQSAGGFDVTWDASEDSKDLVYVDVLAPATHAVIRCSAIENGHVFLPYTGSEDGQVAVHRLHRETFKAKGIEPGEVRFDLSKIVAFHR